MNSISNNGDGKYSYVSVQPHLTSVGEIACEASSVIKWLKSKNLPGDKCRYQKYPYYINEFFQNKPCDYLSEEKFKNLN